MNKLFINWIDLHWLLFKYY